MRTAIYARRSTEAQDDSIAQQVRACERYVEEQGWEVGEVYADTASGWKRDTPRPEFDRMMADAGREFEALVVWEVSRLSRRDDDASALSIVWRLRGRGVEVRSVVEPTTGNKLADDLTLLIKGHAAKEESDTKAERVQRGKRAGVLKGVHQGRWAPYGYRNAGRMPSPTKSDRTIHRYEPDPARAEVVREIFDLYLAGQSPQQIANALNDRRVPPPARNVKHRYKRRGEPVWHQSTLRDLIANPLLGGFASYKGARVRGCDCATECDHPWARSLNIPGIVDESVWERAQGVLERRRRPSNRGRGNHSGSTRFLLSGLVWCGECGERIGSRTSKSGRHVYVCRGRRLRDGRCQLPAISQVELDEAVRESFVRQFVDAVDVTATIEAERERLRSMRSGEAVLIREELQGLRDEVARVEQLSARARADYESGALLADLYSSLHADYDDRLERARAGVENLQVALAETERDITTPEIDALLDMLASIRRMVEGHLTATDVPELNAQLCEVFEELSITHEGDRIFVNPVLRPEFVPEGKWRVLDFGDEDQKGVEVVEHLGAVMRKVSLTRQFADHKINDSW